MPFGDFSHAFTLGYFFKNVQKNILFLSDVRICAYVLEEEEAAMKSKLQAQKQDEPLQEVQE